ncbi:cadmium carbonic anhydrase [Roseospira marina]|uniref:Cadmium carbonic anhydrase n=1 Tax=Roseospira marina TaxID=140057 RepID=A0A5M6IEN9_9PROT|nr:delta-class carbonic anhydrase [Roseospira marina]KAA5606741.1 cadmium carbonic anhydrase [Roseospira marina]MBB4313839.1 hypothetical protein [Roseospira marina]MBB5087001.1 hypothetical protein [Roseospira marina]
MSRVLTGPLRRTAATATLLAGVATPAAADSLCQGFGPQTPRDIASTAGTNPRVFPVAPPASEMTLCNIHFHVNAEHKGPGFSISAGDGEHGGFQCNETGSLTGAELSAPEHGSSECHGVKPGDTIEVHWVHTTCDVTPGPGLTSCVSDTCRNPQLRVEAQVFLVVNDPTALDFADFVYGGHVVEGRSQAKALPTGTGAPVQFLGSTTGPTYTDEACSPMEVTWNVRPSCAKVNIVSLNAWCGGNVFEEDHAHGVRHLVTAPDLLSEIH